MKERLKGIAMMAPLALTFFLGSIPFKFVAFALSLLAFNEFCNDFKHKNKIIPKTVGFLLNVCMFTKTAHPEFVDWVNIAVICLAFVSAFLVVIERYTLIDIALLWVGVIYTSFAFSKITCLYDIEGRKMIVVGLILMISFASDTFAYLIGKKIGKHKLITSVSPNKTIEGSVGGIIGAMLVTAIYCYFTNLSLVWFVPIALIGSVVSQLGDLFASSIKRYCGIKDFSNLFPGHGGVLDRFDSVIFVTAMFSVLPINIYYL